MDAFKGLPCRFRVVAGYRFDAMVIQSKVVDVVVEPHWSTKGAVGSLLSGLPADGPCFVVYSDILFRRSLVDAVHAASPGADLVLAVDTRWRQRFVGRTAIDTATAEKISLTGEYIDAIGVDLAESSADAEFVGLAYLSAEVVARIHDISDIRQDCAQWALPGLLAYLLEGGCRAKAVDAAGDWAALDEPQDLARFVLGSKAQTLQRLAGMVEHSAVPHLAVVPHHRWVLERRTILTNLASVFEGQMVAVRSSAVREDGWASSMAGVFDSLLNVPTDQPENLQRAIDTVFKSYGPPDAANEVLVQRMAPRARLSGVVLTRTLSHGAPYLTVNYDDVSGRTDQVTRGVDFSGKTLYCHHSALDSLGTYAPLLASLPAAVQEIVSLVGYDSLDIEFAVDQTGTVNLLQVRPIAAHSGDWRGNDNDLDDVLKAAEWLFSALQCETGPVLGNRTVLSIMTDWNPAEMIGLRPRQLAFDLYRHLITDTVWAQQRAEFGYRDLRPKPLMVSLAGYAYIDVRASLNSFIPAGLPDRTVEAIVNAQIDRLVSDSYKHDKVEFEIAITCFDLTFAAQRAEMRAAGATNTELDLWAAALKHVTFGAMHPVRLDDLDAALRRLEDRRSKLRRGPPLAAALALLDDCRQLGTPAFAHYARHAFIAIALLRSAVREGVLPADAEARFIAGVSTVAGELIADSDDVATGQLTLGAFLDRHGHLRPGAYDIMVPSYREAPDRYLSHMTPTPSRSHLPGWTDGEQAKFMRALSGIGLPGDIDRVKSWMLRAIEGRERAKYIFTRNLSDALDLIREYGATIGLDRQTLSHLGLGDLRTAALGGAVSDWRAWLTARAAINEAAHRKGLRVELPPLIATLRDLRIFHQAQAVANFVGTAEVIAEPCDLETAESPSAVRGRIVLVRQAEPGHDWIFAHAPAGLVTAYGGANSHTTIRTAELHLPAAIGVGESLFEKLRRAGVLRLDCAGRRVEIIR
jgi:hypothetical protein